MSYAVDGHMDAPIQSNTHADETQILENCGQGGVKSCCGVSCLEAVNHLTLLSTPILHVNKVIEHLPMLWMSIQAHPYTVMIVVLQ